MIANAPGSRFVHRELENKFAIADHANKAIDVRTFAVDDINVVVLSLAANSASFSFDEHGA